MIHQLSLPFGMSYIPCGRVQKQWWWWRLSPKLAYTNIIRQSVTAFDGKEFITLWRWKRSGVHAEFGKSLCFHANMSLQCIATNLILTMNFVHPYYRYGYMKKMFKKNIYPVCLASTLAYNGETKPPRSIQQGAGWPKKLRQIRRRSDFASDSDSNITSLNCSAQGHKSLLCPLCPQQLWMVTSQ